MSREKKIDLVILGLLSHNDLTGYDIKKTLDGAVSFFWKGSFGNIYPAFKSMENDGLITKNETPVGGREKITYHITDKGRERLAEWLKEEQASNEMRYETLLKLFFGGSQPKEVTVRNIELFEERIKNDLDLLRSYMQTLEKLLDNEDHLYYYLTATFGVDVYEAYLKWCEKAKVMLK